MKRTRDSKPYKSPSARKTGPRTAGGQWPWHKGRKVPSPRPPYDDDDYKKPRDRRIKTT